MKSKVEKVIILLEDQWHWLDWRIKADRIPDFGLLKVRRNS